MALKYNIGAIGWYNFETLVQALLKAVIGPGVTAFGGSKDEGRDAAFSGNASYPTREEEWAGEWVFQMKSHDVENGNPTNRKSLVSAFPSELKSVLKRHARIDNYVLITNVPLTPKNSDDLHAAARESGFAGNFDVIDGKNVCTLLDNYPQIRRSYPQLLGLADLRELLNQDLYLRGQTYVERWQPELATFVITSAYGRTLALLRERKFAVLDGPPEAGKSTIAAAVALTHVADGFEVIDVRQPDEFFKVWETERQQLFVADDAVGSISLEVDRAEAWSRDLPAVFKRLDADHLLIWTARKYILEEALAHSRLGEAVRDFPGVHEVLVEAGELSLLEKAEMLYNHARHEDLSEPSRELIRKHVYEIILHPNFTPERVRQLVRHVLT